MKVFEKKSLTGTPCRGKSTSVESIGQNSFKLNTPNKAGELRTGDGRRAPIEPHTSPALFGYFSAQGVEGTV